MVLLVEPKLNSIEVLISKALIDLNIMYDKYVFFLLEFFFNLLKQYNTI